MGKKSKNWVDYREIKSGVTMEMVLGHYGLLADLKQSGKNLVGCCPIHKGTNPRQFSVNIEKNIFNCFGDCKSGGNVLDFVAKMEDIPIREAALLLQGWFLQGSGPAEPPASKAPEEKLVRKEKKGNPPAAADAKEEATPEKQEPLEEDPIINPPLTFQLKSLTPNHEFFIERGISKETVEHFGLGFCTKGMMNGRIAIPIHNEQGQLVAYCGRAVTQEQIENEGKYKQPPNFVKTAVVYNLHRQPEKADLFILVESFLSVFRLHQAGYPNTLALMGSVLSEAQEALIAGRLSAGGKVLLFFDNDGDGQKCAADCLSRLGRHAFAKVLDVGVYGRKPHHLKPEELKALIG